MYRVLRSELASYYCRLVHTIIIKPRGLSPTPANEPNDPSLTTHSIVQVLFKRHFDHLKTRCLLVNPALSKNRKPSDCDYEVNSGNSTDGRAIPATSFFFWSMLFYVLNLGNLWQ